MPDDVDYSSPMPYMWADTLQAAEHAHLLRLLVWAVASIVTGTALMAWLRVRGHQSDLLVHFALQAALWGSGIAIIAATRLPKLAPRDVAGATRLDRLLWLTIGIDAGLVLAGAAIAIVGWRVGRHQKLVGAGMGVVVQGFALALLGLTLAAQISR